MKEIEKKTLFGALLGYADSTRITQEETAYPKAAEEIEKQRQNRFE
ncbi:hypothetical protein [uncultured Clostridium sp.]|nr:hypothetical protein [uncultured Clostridium sp.]